ncbi:hypothetical protein LB524_23405 [Mesorhizobium sp. ESP6-5]|uniref:hypothetical protein n=1 Tax=Mesorhizobium sp. ESP6-5 TaxID=2876623 RepID=UPI001CCEC672|nr:hypothetical protein [Mesorhizobium sp. ESP6-5]MBZ9758236.1 hypothetical protein [Mesorhizobium sp. ESP6-5]
MILNNGALAAVTDGESLRLFHNKGHEPYLDLIEVEESVPATTHAGSGGQTSAI